VYMGQRGSFSVYGFGEAADAYFNKSIKDLTLPEAALLAGMVRGPNLYSPYRYPERARQRRNWVLGMMAENHFISGDQAAQAESAPLGVTQRNVGGTQAPYFVDLVKDEMTSHIPEQDLLSHSYRVYTTLDPGLQAAASQAARLGIQEVDQRLRARHRKSQGPGEPQVALVVLDPHDGRVLALVGGRNYAASQLNHALALRQPGSSFKPFVYAAALSSAVNGSQPLITASSLLPDQPTTFQFENQTYEPKDYKDEYYGTVTVREALALSLNVATVNLAQMVGYDKIRDLALAAGIDHGIQATPAIALGAYVTTPLQIAGAYTVFADNGVYKSPRCIIAVKDRSGNTLWQSATASRTVLDPRVAYLMVNLMQTVIEHGTGEGVRARGFMAPAAGKTGTSRDGWFAGFTSNLLAVAWVGYDNDKNLGLSGASSALPVWTAFMKSAIRLPAYQNMQAFVQPLGIIAAPIDSKSLLLTAGNPLAVNQDLYIDGTQPMSPGVTSRLSTWLNKLLPFAKNRTASVRPAQTPPRAAPEPPLETTQQAAQAPAPSSKQANSSRAQTDSAPPPPSKPPSLIKKFFSIFKHHKHKP
ncbi:MAG: transglycosylase domain-containing protein, partial [Terriglobia bacterium]